MNDPVLVILRDARSIIAEGQLCKYAYARRANGLECLPTDPRAVSHCAIGAIWAAAGIETPTAHRGPGRRKCPAEVYEAFAELHAAIKNGSIADWNNPWYRTKRGVLRGFDRAIAFREREATVTVPPLPTSERIIHKAL